MKEIRRIIIYTYTKLYLSYSTIVLQVLTSSTIRVLPNSTVLVITILVLDFD